MFTFESDPGIVPLVTGFDRKVNHLIAKVVLSNLRQAFEFQTRNHRCVTLATEFVVSRKQLVEHCRKGNQRWAGVDALASNLDAPRLTAYPRILLEHGYVMTGLGQQCGCG